MQQHPLKFDEYLTYELYCFPYMTVTNRTKIAMVEIELGSSADVPREKIELLPDDGNHR